MVKYYCDKCKQSTTTPAKIQIVDINKTTKVKHLCPTCFIKATVFIDDFFGDSKSSIKRIEEQGEKHSNKQSSETSGEKQPDAKEEKEYTTVEEESGEFAGWTQEDHAKLDLILEEQELRKKSGKQRWYWTPEAKTAILELADKFGAMVISRKTDIQYTYIYTLKERLAQKHVTDVKRVEDFVDSEGNVKLSSGVKYDSGKVKALMSAGWDRKDIMGDLGIYDDEIYDELIEKMKIAKLLK